MIQVRCADCNRVIGYEDRGAPPRGSIVCIECGEEEIRIREQAEDEREAAAPAAETLTKEPR